MATKNKEKDIVKKSIWKRWWKKIVGILTILGIVWGVLEGVYFFTKYWHEYQVLKENVQSEDYEERISDLETYVINKKKSFAVGFRVFKEVDELTGKTTFKKKYRNWGGVWNDVFYDAETSDIYGVDYYFYYDIRTGEKIYCW